MVDNHGVSSCHVCELKPRVPKINIEYSKSFSKLTRIPFGVVASSSISRALLWVSFSLRISATGDGEIYVDKGTGRAFRDPSNKKFISLKRSPR